MKEKLNPDYLFEVSWEVCNKVGGIYTVVSTKALNMSHELKNNHILIGPDIWHDTDRNPDFIEDTRLLRSWREKAAQEGLRVRVGHWNVAGNPIVILVEFKSFIQKKDEIFSRFWETYQLDSISGQWDYIESALFGYAAGKVIESFTHFHISLSHRVVAQFHEWMTGTGILYLKENMPQIGTTFTTHATVMGRCIAGNNLPLYDKMESYNPDEKARQFNVISKHSLEKISAQTADCFTTVSDITARECKHFLGKEVDIVTPNGFENTFTPSEDEFSGKQEAGRKKLLQVTQAILNRPVADDALLIGISGRYEFKNKGIDVFIEALGKLNRMESQRREVLAFVLIPAGHHGPNKELLYNLQNPDKAQDLANKYLTHYLSDTERDAVLNAIKQQGLTNEERGKVNIIFVPSYLNGVDGIFNMPYYDLLVALDLSIFPSYYEPWGYTPLESLAFKVPTITTSLAGFGMWVEARYNRVHPSIEVIMRNDSNASYVVDEVVKKVQEISLMNDAERKKVKENAEDVSKIALWENHIKYYKKAYHIALEKVEARVTELPAPQKEQISYIGKQMAITRPTWSRVMIHRQIPESLKVLEELSKNLWWSWNQEAVDLFKYIDPELWVKVRNNPIALLDKVSYKRYQELEKDKQFLQMLTEVHEAFFAYMEDKKHLTGPRISYFSMEYGLHSSLKIYSGGLGILAGDYLKEASDKGVRMTGVGLLYSYGYFTQKLSSNGDQEAEYELQDFLKIPASPMRDKDGNWITVGIAFPGRILRARIWRVDVGRIELYLLDTDYEDNTPEDRTITYHLYGGDWENRLKQEILLGVGGIRALREIGIEADVYHCNEGHAALIGMERLREFIMNDNLTFAEAMEVVRSSSLFTTHTPVPAGHDAFSENMLRTYMSHYPERLKITWEQMMALGKINANDPNEKFSMSYLASNLSQEINGVSWLHGKVSQEILKDLWPGYLPEELHVSYVTNGVHYPTWTAPEWKDIHKCVFGNAFGTHNYDKSCFDGIYKVDDKEIWDVRNKLRKRMMNAIKHELTRPNTQSYFAPRDIVEIKESLRDDVLTIGFARRFATYKRAHLLFSNLDRLAEIVNNSNHPVQFLFAGKAHPADKAGQDLIKRIVEVSKMPRFLGKILFLPNYDIDVAKMLVQGVDIWMNTPTRPLEASGTSGEKAVMNGVMHFSVLDGWWVEGYQPGAGWALPMEKSYESPAYQDELDAETIYSLLENEIVPSFYQRNKDGISESWMNHIKNTVAKVACNFTTNRMLNDYEEKYYKPLSKRHQKMIQHDYAEAKHIAEWKKKVEREWDNIEVISYVQPDNVREELALGKEYSAEAVIHIGSLQPEDIGVELVLAEETKDNTYRILAKHEFELVSQQGSAATYRVKVTPDTPGTYFISGRIYAKNPKLPHRQDFALVKWM